MRTFFKEYDLFDYVDNAIIVVEEKYKNCKDYKEYLKKEFEQSDYDTFYDYLKDDNRMCEYLEDSDDFVDNQYKLMIYDMQDDLMKFLSKSRRRDISFYKKKLHEEESILCDSGWYKLPKFEKIEGFIKRDDRYGYSIDLDETELISLLYTI